MRVQRTPIATAVALLLSSVVTATSAQTSVPKPADAPQVIEVLEPTPYPSPMPSRLYPSPTPSPSGSAAPSGSTNP